jgi:hypothetical protein
MVVSTDGNERKFIVFRVWPLAIPGIMTATDAPVFIDRVGSLSGWPGFPAPDAARRWSRVACAC